MSERSSLMPGDRDSAVRNESRLMRYQLEYRLVPPDSSASSEAGTACLLEDALEIQGDPAGPCLFLSGTSSSLKPKITESDFILSPAHFLNYTILDITSGI